MNARVNTLSRWVLLVLSLSPLATVLVGYTQPPVPDEGTLAHIFQLATVGLVAVGAVFVVTADWTDPRGVLRRMRIPATAVNRQRSRDPSTASRSATGTSLGMTARTLKRGRSLWDALASTPKRRR